MTKTNRKRKVTTKNIKAKDYVSKQWTEKRVENLIKFFKQYREHKNWATKISKRMRTFSSDAIYKKASRMGLKTPDWAIMEKDTKGMKRSCKNKV